MSYKSYYMRSIHTLTKLDFPDLESDVLRDFHH